MNRIRMNLSVALSQPWVGWVFVVGTVTVYGVLVLMETRSGWHRGLSWSWFWAHVFLFAGRGTIGFPQWHYVTWAPVSFVLPGYPQTLRRSNLARAVRWGILFSLALFSETWNRSYLFEAFAEAPKSLSVAPSIPELCVNVIGGLLTGVTAHLLLTSGPLLGFGWGWFLTSCAGVLLNVVAWSLALRYPLAVWPMLLALSVPVCGFLWLRLRDASWVRSGHRRCLLLGMGDPDEEEEEQEEGTDVETEVSSRVEEFFLSWMRREDSEAGTRYLWGWLYCAFGPILSQWQGLLILLLAGALVLGFLGRPFAELAILLLSMHMTRRVWCAPSTVFLPEGRRERYHRIVALGVSATLLLIASAAGLVVLSRFLAPFISSIPLGTHHFSNDGVSLASVWPACLIAPWFLLSRALPKGWFIQHYVIPIAVGLLVFMELRGAGGSSILPPILLVCGWTSFLLTAWITCRRWDLVGQRPLREA